jgi:hypothetical protein
MVPDRAGADTRVESVVALSQLRDLPGAPVLEEAWLAARAGEHGYLAGKDAEVIACDALIIPVVTGSADWAVIGQMITLRGLAGAAVRTRQARHRLRLRPRRHRLGAAHRAAPRPVQHPKRPPRRGPLRQHP